MYNLACEEYYHFDSFYAPTYFIANAVERGAELVEIDKLDKAMKEFADAIEKGQSKQTVEKFLKILKLNPIRR